MKPLLLIACLVPILTACWGMPYVGYVDQRTDQVTLNDLLQHESQNQVMPVQLTGAVPGLSAPETAAAMSNKNWGKPVAFEPLPDGTTADWRVILQVDPGFQLIGFSPCEDAPIEPQQTDTQTETAIHAAFCYKQVAYSEAIGLLPAAVSSPDDSRELLTTLVRTLFPNPYRKTDLTNCSLLPICND